MRPLEPRDEPDGLDKSFAQTNRAQKSAVRSHSKCIMGLRAARHYLPRLSVEHLEKAGLRAAKSGQTTRATLDAICPANHPLRSDPRSSIRYWHIRHRCGF
ncbi:hypothetical protein AAFF_G00249180 [Aldrovandia affinis]|uniref:Uncharacterized protein n=1 Tax=Aldrovandia affinis TaxID=143900 RepID=A0AAD7RD97_9TELE|nr:hypothetical protein AAFF_G00249180 [Aldrovandia affinis]